LDTERRVPYGEAAYGTRRLVPGSVRRASDGGEGRTSQTRGRSGWVGMA